MLTKQDFGAWVLFITISAIIEVVRQSLLRNGLILFLADQKNNNEKDVRVASLVLNILITLFSVIIIFYSAEWLAELWDSPDLVYILNIYCITAIILIPFSHFEYLFQAKYDFKGIFISNVMRNGSFFIIVLLGFLNLLTIDLPSLIVYHLIGASLGSISYLIIIRKNTYLIKNVQWVYVKSLFSYGKYVLGTGLSSILNTSVDQFMIGSLMSTVYVAIYNAANRVTTLVITPSTVIASVVFPKSAEMATNKNLDSLKTLYEKSVAVNMAIIVPAIAFVMIFPGFVITVVAGSSYLDAIPVLRWMMVIAFFIPLARSFGVTIDALGQPHINFIVTSLGTVCNITLNYFLINKYGVIGAIYGTIGVASVSYAFMHIILKRKLNVSLSNVGMHMLNLYVVNIKSLLTSKKNS